nr:reverse transcriptase domain-containing protein [Tanacetum cinerariifolium]
MDIIVQFQDKGTSLSKQKSQGSSMTFMYKTLIIPSFLDSCFISSTVSEDKRVMLCLDLKIYAQDKNFLSIWAYMTMMLLRVRNHHGENVYIRDLVDFDVTISTSRGKQCPHQGFSELHQLDTFYNALNPNDQDALDSAVGGNFLDKIPRECLSIIESKSKVRYSRSRVTDLRANTNAPPSSSSPSNSFDLQQIAASLEDKLDIRMSRFQKSLNDMKVSFVTPTAPIKAVEEVCVTCGANLSYNHCPLTRGNEFPVFHDNIQQF